MSQPHPSEKQSPGISILFCADDAYLEPLCTTIYSLLYNNSHRLLTLNVLLLNASDFSLNRIQELVNQFPQAGLVALAFDAQRLPHCFLSGHISITAYARLFVGQFLGPDTGKVLYLDSDLIIQSRIDSLWETEMDGCSVAAVPDPWTSHMVEFGWDRADSYYNSGVLLIDVDRWRAENKAQTFSQVIEEMGSRLRYWDQDVMNLVFKNEIRPLDYRWNFASKYAEASPKLLNMTRRAYLQTREKPNIIHFTSHVKPWLDQGVPHYKETYLYYARQLPWNRSKKISLLRWNRSNAVTWVKWHFPLALRMARKVFRVGDPFLRQW